MYISPLGILWLFATRFILTGPVAAAFKVLNWR